MEHLTRAPSDSMALSRTPFHAHHVAAGARMVEFAGFEMPVSYTSLREEHSRVREAVGLFDVSHMGEVAVHGPEALSALQWLVSNDVSALAPGQACYAVMCNERGGIVDDLFVYRRGDERFLVVVNAANRDKDFAWMVEHAPNPDGALFTDASSDWALLAVQGPKAEATLQGLVEPDLSGVEGNAFVECAVAGVEGCLVARTGYTGEDGFEIYAPATAAGPLWPALLEAGAPHDILPCGLGARDTLRLEVRNALYGHELTESTSPWQAGLAFVVAEGKPGGFLGLEALQERKGNESHRLAGIVLDGRRIPRQGNDVLHGGEVVGEVTSGTRSPTLDQSICLAYVRRDLFRPGTRLTIDIRGKHAEGEVIRGRFYDPSTRE